MSFLLNLLPPRALFGGIFNLTNSIMGVSLLAMPLCFYQCGLAFGMFLSLLATFLSLISCKLMLHSSRVSGRSTFEALGLQAHGKWGKLAVEVCIIGLLLGSCVAFFAIVADILPRFASVWFFPDQSAVALRTPVMSILAVAVVFPLSLMRNVSSLSPLNAISLGFYGCFIVALIYSIASPSEAEQAPEGAPSSELKWFDPSGFLLTLPIFSLAYTCQFGVFAVYAGLPNPNHKAMNTVINYSIFLASFLYSAVGVFGYIAFSHVDIDGDLLNNFPDGVVFFDILKLGFSISIIFSFPITVYPCRAALNTLIFVPNAPASTTPDVLQSAAAPEPVIPGARFFGLTAGIVFSALIVALAIPEVATILSFTGSTTGTSLAYILPASTFLVLVRAADVKPRLRRIAILILVLGVVCCIGSTALVLYSTNPLPVKEVTNSVDIPIEGDTGVKERDVSSSLNRSISSLSLQSFSRLPSVVSLPISSSAEAGLPSSASAQSSAVAKATTRVVPKKSLVNKR